MVVHSSKEAFLAWEGLRRAAGPRSLAAYDVKSGQTRELLPEMKLGSYDLSEDGSFITYSEDITKKTDYDVIGGTENQIHLMPAAGGPPRTIIKSTKGISVIWSRDNRRYAYAKDGNIFFGSIDDKEARQLTGKKPDADKDKPDAASDKPKDDTGKDTEKEKKDKEKFNAVRLSPKGDSLVASNKEGLWLVDTQSGAKEMFVKTGDEDKESPRYQVVDFSPDGDSIYLSYASRTKWDRGVVRYDPVSRRLEDLLKDSRIYSNTRLSKDGRTFVFLSAEGNRPIDLFAADSQMKNVRRLTDTNPQLKTKRLSRTELVPYLDADGNKLYGVLYYPVDYEAGKKYPTVLNIYEQFFDDPFSGTINVLTSNGYAVMQPSVNLEIGFPGEAWVKGVTAAANKLIEMGVADPERLGVQGTSYGGYATNLLITQTNRFKAAINISGKVNMISFYTDSPRLGVRNIHAPEKSQDRIGATLWQQPQKYIQHSAIMFADRIKTPLLLMTGEQDHNVPARQHARCTTRCDGSGRSGLGELHQRRPRYANNHCRGGKGLSQPNCEVVRRSLERRSEEEGRGAEAGRFAAIRRTKQPRLVVRQTLKPTRLTQGACGRPSTHPHKNACKLDPPRTFSLSTRDSHPRISGGSI